MAYQENFNEYFKGIVLWILLFRKRLKQIFKDFLFKDNVKKNINSERGGVWIS